MYYWEESNYFCKVNAAKSARCILPPLLRFYFQFQAWLSTSAFSLVSSRKFMKWNFRWDNFSSPAERIHQSFILIHYISWVIQKWLMCDWKDKLILTHSNIVEQHIWRDCAKADHSDQQSVILHFGWWGYSETSVRVTVACEARYNVIDLRHFINSDNTVNDTVKSNLISHLKNVNQQHLY